MRIFDHPLTQMIQSQKIHAVYLFRKIVVVVFLKLLLFLYLLFNFGMLFFTRFFGLKKISGGGCCAMWCITVITHGICSEWMPVGQFCIYMCKKSRQGFYIFAICGMTTKRSSVTLKLLCGSFFIYLEVKFAVL